MDWIDEFINAEELDELSQCAEQFKQRLRAAHAAHCEYAEKLAEWKKAWEERDEWLD